MVWRQHRGTGHGPFIPGPWPGRAAFRRRDGAQVIQLPSGNIPSTPGVGVLEIWRIKGLSVGLGHLVWLRS